MTQYFYTRACVYIICLYYIVRSVAIEVPITSTVAGFVDRWDTQDFRDYLAEENPEWLGQVMIETVESTVTKFSKGYTVPNLLGPQVFPGFSRFRRVHGGCCL